jgi:hypothetical protein
VGFGEIGEEDWGFGFVTGLGGEDRVVPTGMLAEDDWGARRDFETEALGADGCATVVADFDGGAHAPHEGPPRTRRHGLQHGALFLFGGVPGGLRFHLQFAVDFVPVAVAAQLANVGVGLLEVGDLLAGEVGGQAVLPELMFPFDLALGLGRGGVTETHAVKVKGRAQLRERVGDVGEEEGMEVDIEFQRQAVFQERGGEKIVIGQERFAFVELGGDEEAAAIVEHVEHGKEAFYAWKPAVRRDVELPEFADPGALPAADGRGGLGVGFGMGQLVSDGPAADLGAIQFEATEAQDFAGEETGVGGRRRSEPLAQERQDVGGPVGGVIAAGDARRPVLLMVVGTGAEIIGLEFVEATPTEVEFAGGGASREEAGAELGEDEPDQRCGETMRELAFFIGRA